jgi:hypothetical protein
MTNEEKAVIEAAIKLAKFLPKGYGEKLVTHYDPEVEGLVKAVEALEKK